MKPDQVTVNPKLLPPLTLAYVGDAVYELFVRQRLVLSGRMRVSDLHKAAVRYVKAQAQAKALAEIMPGLSEDEQDIARRGRNAKSHAAPKGASLAEYTASTGFEALVGFLFLAGRQERLEEVLAASARYLEQ